MEQSSRFVRLLRKRAGAGRTLQDPVQQHLLAATTPPALAMWPALCLRARVRNTIARAPRLRSSVSS